MRCRERRETQAEVLKLEWKECRRDLKEVWGGGMVVGGKKVGGCRRMKEASQAERLPKLTWNHLLVNKEMPSHELKGEIAICSSPRAESLKIALMQDLPPLYPLNLRTRQPDKLFGYLSRARLSKALAIFAAFSSRTTPLDPRAASNTAWNSSDACSTVHRAGNLGTPAERRNELRAGPNLRYAR
ncbi:hypothetical protein B0H17DRAFT_1154054 [Mycena rosella]|uniref:Uncharacterized protein n=1 Tax=Mycena rosella TaxID=1033263 RepID=A0AAD7B0L1_MYCRO|nr:hypothetical protein B0H17DRAFT_1154054 [Mycena rosella]